LAVLSYPDSTMSTCGVNNVVFDGFSDHVRDLLDKGVSMDVANSLRLELVENNPYIHDLVSIGQALHYDIPAVTTFLSVTAHQEELSILRNQDQDRGYQTIYQFTLAGAEEDTFLDNNSEQVEPLMYPLLFPYGERGWGSDLKVVQPKIDLMDYLKSKLLQPEPDLIIRNWQDEMDLEVNRYQVMSRLGQY